jgi:hypothetical protein
MEMLGLSVFLHGLLLTMQKLGLRLSKAA